MHIVYSGALAFLGHIVRSRSHLLSNVGRRYMVTNFIGKTCNETSNI